MVPYGLMALGVIVMFHYLRQCIKTGQCRQFRNRCPDSGLCRSASNCWNDTRARTRYYCSICVDFCRKSPENDNTTDGSTRSRPSSGNPQQRIEIGVIDLNLTEDLSKPPSYEEFIANYTSTNNAATVATSRSGLPAPPSYESVVSGEYATNSQHI